MSMFDPYSTGRFQATTRRTAADAAHIASMTGKIIKLWGFIDTTDTGELLYDIEFPILFIELPSFAYGSILAEGQTIEVGAYPTASVTVHSFAYDARPSGPRYYKGAKLILVSTGLPGQRMTFSYQFEARAIVPPVRTDATADDLV